MLKQIITIAAVAGLVFALGATASADSITGLIARYQFENAADPGEDWTGNYPATPINGAAPAVDGVRGNVLYTAPNAAGLQVGASYGTGSIPVPGDWTISMWYKNEYGPGNWRPYATSGSRDHILGKVGTHNLTADNVLSGYAFDGSLGGPDARVGWHHLAGVASGGNTDFYIDGGYVGTAAAHVTMDVFGLGTNPTGVQESADYLDEVRIYGRALSPGDIVEVYNDLVIPEPASLALLLIGLPFVMRRKRR